MKNELWDAAILKVRQLEAEIRASGASDREKSNMLHTHSKLWMFATDAWDQEVVRPAQKSRADNPSSLEPTLIECPTCKMPAGLGCFGDGKGNVLVHEERARIAPMWKRTKP